MAKLRDVINATLSSTPIALTRDMVLSELAVGSGPSWWGELLLPDNDHLAKKIKTARLTGEEEVQGKYLTISYNDHKPAFRLFSHPSLSAMERYILSPAGIINDYLAFVVAFVDFEFTAYLVRYPDASGNMIIFEKGKHDMFIFEQVDEKGMELEIEWIPKRKSCTVSQSIGHFD